MSVSYFVRYRGEAEDKAAILDYYRNAHAPLLWRFPGLQGLDLHHGIESHDAFPVTPDDTMLLARMVFGSVDDLDRALVSEARARARDDFARMPAFAGDITHQAMRIETIGR